jgi:hypothetical protein
MDLRDRPAAELAALFSGGWPRSWITWTGTTEDLPGGCTRRRSAWHRRARVSVHDPS